MTSRFKLEQREAAIQLQREQAAQREFEEAQRRQREQTVLQEQLTQVEEFRVDGEIDVSAALEAGVSEETLRTVLEDPSRIERARIELAKSEFEEIEEERPPLVVEREISLFEATPGQLQQLDVDPQLIERLRPFEQGGSLNVTSALSEGVPEGDLDKLVEAVQAGASPSDLEGVILTFDFRIPTTRAAIGVIVEAAASGADRETLRRLIAPFNPAIPPEDLLAVGVSEDILERAGRGERIESVRIGTETIQVGVEPREVGQEPNLEKFREDARALEISEESIVSEIQLIEEVGIEEYNRLDRGIQVEVSPAIPEMPARPTEVDLTRTAILLQEAGLSNQQILTEIALIQELGPEAYTAFRQEQLQEFEQTHFQTSLGEWINRVTFESQLRSRGLTTEEISVQERRLTSQGLQVWQQSFVEVSGIAAISQQSEEALQIRQELASLGVPQVNGNQYDLKAALDRGITAEDLQKFFNAEDVRRAQLADVTITPVDRPSQETTEFITQQIATQEKIDELRRIERQLENPVDFLGPRTPPKGETLESLGGTINVSYTFEIPEGTTATEFVDSITPEGVGVTWGIPDTTRPREIVVTVVTNPDFPEMNTLAQQLFGAAVVIIPGFWLARNWGKLDPAERSIFLAYEVLLIAPALRGVRLIGRGGRRTVPSSAFTAVDEIDAFTADLIAQATLNRNWELVSAAKSAAIGNTKRVVELGSEVLKGQARLDRLYDELKYITKDLGLPEGSATATTRQAIRDTSRELTIVTKEFGEELIRIGEGVGEGPGGALRVSGEGYLTPPREGEGVLDILEANLARIEPLRATQAIAYATSPGPEAMARIVTRTSEVQAAAERAGVSIERLTKDIENVLRQPGRERLLEDISRGEVNRISLEEFVDTVLAGNFNLQVNPSVVADAIITDIRPLRELSTSFWEAPRIATTTRLSSLSPEVLRALAPFLKPIEVQEVAAPEIIASPRDIPFPGIQEAPQLSPRDAPIPFVRLPITPARAPTPAIPAEFETIGFPDIGTIPVFEDFPVFEEVPLFEEQRRRQPAAFAQLLRGLGEEVAQEPLIRQEPVVREAVRGQVRTLAEVPPVTEPRPTPRPPVRPFLPVPILPGGRPAVGERVAVRRCWDVRTLNRAEHLLFVREVSAGVTRRIPSGIFSTRGAALRAGRRLGFQKCTKERVGRRVRIAVEGTELPDEGLVEIQGELQ